MEFFQALVVCHTIQVAGDKELINKKIGKTNENIPKEFKTIYPIPNISEERSSFNKKMIGFRKVKGEGAVTLDVNPLLEVFKKSRNSKRTEIVKQSSSINRTIRVRPTSGSEKQISSAGKTSPSLLLTAPSWRPMSVQLMRSTSEIHLPENNIKIAADDGYEKTHRRVQSYAAPPPTLNSSCK